jgi:DNA-binding PadR family transcriptional regulator
MPGRRSAWSAFGEGPSGRLFRGGRGGRFGRGKMLADGDLRLIVLALLAEQPRHGYDIIKALEEHSSGAYTPSPGVVYPTLTYLEEAGYVTATSEGSKKVYAITENGRTHLAANRDIADMILESMGRYGERMARARVWFYRHEDGCTDIPGVIAEVNEARRALKRAIAERLDAPEAEQRRIADILNQAAAAIRGADAAGDGSPTESSPDEPRQD